MWSSKTQTTPLLSCDRKHESCAVDDSWLSNLSPWSSGNQNPVLVAILLHYGNPFVSFYNGLQWYYPRPKNNQGFVATAHLCGRPHWLDGPIHCHELSRHVLRLSSGELFQKCFLAKNSQKQSRVKVAKHVCSLFVYLFSWSVIEVTAVFLAQIWWGFGVGGFGNNMICRPNRVAGSWWMGSRFDTEKPGRNDSGWCDS